MKVETLRTWLTYICKSLGDSMSYSFSTWEEYLKEICRHHTPFLTQFAEEMATKLLVSSTNSDTEKDPYRDGIYSWFEHILKSSSWALLRKQYLLLSYVQAVCRDYSDYWGERLNDLVGNVSDELGPPRGAMNGKDDESSKRAPPTATEESESDAEALGRYGWSMSKRRSFKPIGAI